MKIVVVGGTGTIGAAVAAALTERHEVIRVGRSSGDFHADMEDRASLGRLYRAVGQVNAVVAAAGDARFKPFDQLEDADFRVGIDSKLMGQVNLVLTGVAHVRDGGSFTLTTGILSSEPAPDSVAITPVNAAVEGFCRAAALELPRGVRINVVSPPWLSETLEQLGRDPAQGMPAARVARAYVAAVEGSGTGEVLDAREYADR